MISDSVVVVENGPDDVMGDTNEKVGRVRERGRRVSVSLELLCSVSETCRRVM